MKVEGPSFFNYDPQHIQVIRQELAQSIRPQVFKDVDDSVAMALLLSDMVSLSPEAQELLKKIKNHLERGESAKGESLEDLTYNLKQLRELVYGKPKQKGDKLEQPFNFQLSGKEMDEESRKKAAAGLSSDTVARMIGFAPNEAVKRALVKELEVLGEKIISQVKNFGVRIIILPANQALTELKIAGMTMVAPGERTVDGRPWEIVRGIYDQSRRLIVVGEERVGVPGHSAARHEFAHAFDHTFTVKNQRRLPLSVQLWNFFREKREDLVSNYAAVNPAEYFAECVERFFNPGGKNQLEQKDPQMYQYLNNLFAA